MVYRRQNDLATILRAAGVPVIEHSGWKSRGMGGHFDPRFVMWHHDGSALGPSPGVASWLLRNFESVGSQVWVCRGCNKHASGTWHLLASGRAYHAGRGGPYRDVAANRMNDFSIGIEVDQTTGEKWDQRVLDSLRKGTAAILKKWGQKANPGLLFHKTWAPGRKVDPWGLDIHAERRAVAALLTTPPPAPAPAPAPTRPVVTLANVRPGKRNADVAAVQRALISRGFRIPAIIAGTATPGFFGRQTLEAYAAYQRSLGFSGTAADGVPGVTSLRRLGFDVRT
jgi:hypothetical protein